MKSRWSRGAVVAIPGLVRYAVLFFACLAALPSDGSGQHVRNSGSSAPFEPHGIFLGNEGIVLNPDGTSLVLLDGLFREGVDGYQTVPPRLRETFEGAIRIGGGVSLAVATHHHPDHFDAAAVVAYLEANPSGRFVSTPNAVARIRDLAPGDDVMSRVVSSYPAENERESFEFDGVGLQTLNLHHGRSRSEIQNLGHLVEFGGLRALHMGDTEVTTDEILRQRLRDDELDVAFVPYWLLLGDEGPGVVRAINANIVYAIHIPGADADASWWGEQGSREGTVRVLERLEGVRVLVEPGSRFSLR